MDTKKLFVIFILMTFSIVFVNSVGDLYKYKIPDVKYMFNDEKVVRFIKCIKSRNYNEAESLIKDGVDIESKGQNDITPLYYFFLIKDYKGFNKLLEMGANPNVDPADVYGFFVLLNGAMYTNDDRYFKLLLKYNADVNFISKKGDRSPLERSLSSYVNIKYLKLLLEHGAKVENNEKYWVDSHILSALFYREYKKVILLLEYNPQLLNDERIKNLIIKKLGEYNQFPGSQLLRDQKELVKYLKDKFNITVILNYPNGRIPK